MEKAKKRFAYLVIIPALVYLLFWTVLPYVWVLLLTLFDYSPRRAGIGFLGLGGNNPFLGLEHFRNMLRFGPAAPKKVAEFHLAFRNTLIFAFLVLPLNLALTLPLAVAVNGVLKRGFQKILRSIYFLPVITSSVGVGIMWGYIFNPQKGLLNAFLSKILDRTIFINWIGDATINIAGVNVALLCILVAYLWMDLGYNFIIYLAALQGIPDQILESAEIDGVSQFSKFFRITLPLLMPQILLTAILTLISAFQQFDLVQVMTKGGPNHMSRVMVLDIYENAFRYEDMGWASAVSLIFFVVIFSITMIQRKVLGTNWEY